MSDFLKCENCGKKLIRLVNGKLIFKFGLQSGTTIPAVSLEIEGVCKITCLTKWCKHINIFKTEKE
jgi:hypothetical protein